MNKNLTEKIYNDMTTLLKEKNLIKSIPSLTIVDAFKEVDCQAYIVTHEVNGIEKYEVYVNDSSYDDIVKNLKTNKEKSINDIKRLLNKKIHLDLWVKVKKDWKDRPNDLKVLGYSNDNF